MTRIAVIVVALTVAFAGTARATDFQLTALGQSVTINGAIFTTIDPQPTGTGNFDPFLKFQATPRDFAQAYNYDQATFTSKIAGNDSYGSDNWTHLLETSDLAVVVQDGVSYWKFVLDIDQTGSSPYMSLDYLTFSTSNSGSIHGGITGTGNLATLTFPNLGNQFYTMGANHLELNYGLNSGSGSGDLYVLVPVPTTVNRYLYLANAMGYSSTMFGSPTTENDGPEEWAALKGTSQVPEPTSLLLLGVGLLGLGLLGRRHG